MASYNPKVIYQMGITDKANDAQLNAIDTEASTVEDNISIINEQATRITKTLSALKVSLDLGEFHSLIADLGKVLKIIRELVKLQQAVNSEKDANRRKELSARLSAYDPPLPAMFRKPAAAGQSGTLCPLTVFLQAVSASLTTLKIRRIAGGMGTAQAIIGLLEAMSTQLNNANGRKDECRGLANCIMIHEKNSRFIVFGTAPCYRKLRGLQDFAWETRDKYLMKLEAKLPEAARDRLRDAERFSRQILDDSRAGNKPIQAPDGYTQLVINGTNVSVTAKGKYKTACLTDWLRMVIERPEAAQEEENQMPVAKRRPQEKITSCAEWILVTYLLYSPDPANPPTLGRPTAGSHKKSDSWPKNGERPKVAVAAAKAPEALPNKLGEAKGGKGRAA